jgi:hypothetical protein
VYGFERRALRPIAVFVHFWSDFPDFWGAPQRQRNRNAKSNNPTNSSQFPQGKRVKLMLAGFGKGGILTNNASC